MTEVLIASPIAVATLLTALWYSKLPGSIAVHFDISGKPDLWVNKSTGLLLVPFIGLAAYIIPYIAARQYSILRFVCTGFVSFIVAGTVLLPNLGKKKLMFAIGLPLAVGFFLFIVIWSLLVAPKP